MNGKIYLFDTTIKKPDYVFFNTTGELAAYLNGVCYRAFNKTRDSYMQELTDLGHGYDDGENVAFIRAMNEYFNIGIVKNSRFVKCDVTMEQFNRPEFGN